MLVLSRKPGECIRIGDDIVIRVSKISGTRVQLSIDAPAGMAIRRTELPGSPGRTDLSGVTGQTGFVAVDLGCTAAKRLQVELVTAETPEHSNANRSWP